MTSRSQADVALNTLLTAIMDGVYDDDLAAISITIQDQFDTRNEVLKIKDPRTHIVSAWTIGDDGKDYEYPDMGHDTDGHYGYPVEASTPLQAIELLMEANESFGREMGASIESGVWPGSHIKIVVKVA